MVRFWHSISPILASILVYDAITSVDAQDITVSSLLVENKPSPIGIDVIPRFSWIVGSSERGVQQLSYRLSVSAEAAGQGDVWDSGDVSSNKPYGVQYAGKGLASDTRYFWSVNVTTSAGSGSASSDFTTGFLSAQDWAPSVWIGNPFNTSTPTSPSFSGSTWIWSSEVNPPEAPAGPRAFRKTFAAPQGKQLKSADIVLTVDDGFTLYVDGNLIDSSPNSTDTWKSAQRFPVPLSGNSTLFAVLGVNLADVSTGGDSPAGLLAVINVTYADGTSDSIRSDVTWKVDKEVVSGFELPSTDDSDWPVATSFGDYGASPWGTGVSLAASLTEHPAPLLRKEFDIQKSVSYARLYYSAGGYASITVNGAPASDRVLTPGFTKYDTELQYVAVDIADKLTQGVNAVGVELGRSHYGVTQGNVWSWDTAPWHAEPNVRIVITIGYGDGTTTRVDSDASWRVSEGPTRLDDVFGGENYDASYIIPGFDKPGLDDSSWVSAKVVTGPIGVLVNQGQPPTRVIETLTPVSISEPVKGIFVAEFERVVAGWVRLSVAGPAKTLITVHFGEKLNDDGTVIYEDLQHYYANNFQTDRFWLAGTGQEETFEPKFSYKGYQYVQLEGWPASSTPTADNISGKVVHDDLAPHGGFESSNDLLNKLHKASVYTLLNNVHSIPEDCPTFEKNGWSGDAMLSTEMFLTNLNAQDLLAKYTRDLDESRSNGSGPPAVIAPDSGWGANNQAPTWHSAFIFIPWWLFQYKGDKRLLEEHYASMKNYVEFELGRSPNNIADTGLGDWDTPETSPLGGNPPEDPHVSATAYLYRMLIVMKNIADVLDQTSDSSTFASQADAVKTAFNGAFLNSSTGYYNGVGDSGYRQTHNLLALAFELVPDNNTAQVVADSIANDVIARGTHLNTGALGTKYILPILSEHGHSDTAFALVVQDTFPSWGFWIANGATTMWEHWSIAARSHDHHFLGTFEDWLYKHVAGIRPSTTAFETVEIAPLLTFQLQSASAWTLTPFGNLTVDWRVTAGTLSVDLDIPVGVNATLTLPVANSPNGVTESGKSLDGREDVRVLDSDGSSVRVSVGSGHYSFAAASSKSSNSAVR